MTEEELSKYKLVVIVTCQGQPYYYFYKNSVKAIIRFLYEYSSKTHYNTMNFTLKNAFLVNVKKIEDYEIRRK